MPDKIAFSDTNELQSPNNVIRVAIAGDYPLFANGIASVINTMPGLLACAAFSNGAHLIDWYNGFNSDIILLDLNMPVLDSGKTGKQLLARYPGAKIIMLSAGNSDLSVNTMRDSGIYGYLTKNIDPDSFIQAILKVYAGEKIFPGNTAAENHQIDKPGTALLSKRELEILKLIVTGNSNKEIANLLNLSGLTVKKHREHLMHKLDAHNSAQLIESARARGLI